jgi:DNA-binding HxlR family transcriptional regulator
MISVYEKISMILYSIANTDKLRIIELLNDSPMRPAELHKALPKINNNYLRVIIKRMKNSGIIESEGHCYKLIHTKVVDGILKILKREGKVE